MAKHLTPEAAVFDLKSLNQAVVSPDGTQVAYVVSHTDRESGTWHSHIWLVPLEGGQPRQITSTNTVNSEPQWSPDGSAIAFCTRQPGDHPGGIALLSLEGGDAAIITSHLKAPSGIRWSADGTHIAYQVEVDPDNLDEVPRNPKSPPPVVVVDRLDYKWDGRGVYGSSRNQVHVVAVDTGERRRLTDLSVHHTSPEWNPAGTQLAVLQAVPDSLTSQIATIDVASGEVTSHESTHGYTSMGWWTPDGEQVLYLADPEASSHDGYALLNVASGGSRTVLDNPIFQPDQGYQNGAPIGTPIWISNTQVIVHGLLNAGSGLWLLDCETGTAEELVTWQAMHGGLSGTSDGSVVVQSRQTLTGAGELVSWNRKTGEQTLLAQINAEFFEQYPMVDWEPISFERVGFTIEGWLLKPPGFDASEKWPLVLSVHGGPHNAYGYSFDVQAQILAANGYLVLMLNPRGSGTYGREFAAAVNGNWGDEDWNDLLAGLDLVESRPYVDSKRTGIYGYSYGGYITAWAIGHTDRFAAAVCGAPVYDFVSKVGTGDVNFHFSPGSMVRDPWKERDRLIDRSPSTYAPNFRTPTMVIQGEADERCPLGQGEQLYVDLKLQGVDAQMIRYPGGSHLMLKYAPAEHRIDYLTRVVNWFDRFLK